MKKNLGKVIIFLVFSFISLYAQEASYCSYELISSKDEATINEPITIKFKTRQKVHDNVMFFDLVAKKSQDYELISITNKRYEFNYHDAKKEFSYLLLPKKSGKIKVSFDFKIRIASDDAVAQAYTGSRDNVKSIPTTDIFIASPSLSINVKTLDKKVDAIGSFKLTQKIDKNQTDAYDSVNIVYTLTGIGFLDESFEPLKSIKGISIFRSKKNNKTRVTEDGYSYEKEWSYALISSFSYKIPKTTFLTFNHKKTNYKNIILEEKSITIIPIDTKNLLDDKEYPKDELDYRKYMTYLYNLIIFLAGFLASKLTKYLPKKQPKKVDAKKAIKKAKSIKELLKLVLQSPDDKELQNEIKKREKIIHSKFNNKN